MGCSATKIELQNDALPVFDATATGSDIIVESEDKFDKQVINYMKNELRNHPERFLLNNLLMSVVFFRNYDTDLYDFSNTAIPQEELDLNNALAKDVKKCILPDALFEKIQENVKFCDGENCEELLSSRTIYVVNDNIEVRDKIEAKLYTSMDVPGCQVVIEEIDEDVDALTTTTEEGDKQKKNMERKGFLKLRVIHLTNTKLDQITTTNLIRTPSCSKSTNTDEDSDEYSVITDFKTPKSINVVKNPIRRDTLPENCFELRKTRRMKLELEDSDDEATSDYEESDEDDFDETPEQRRERKLSELYNDVVYLSSKGFMEYFQNDVFPNTTGRSLGFNEVAICSARAMAGCILCEPYKVIPAVAIDWPFQASEFCYRKSRKAITETRTNIIYKWPTNDMVDEIKTLSCVVIPKGFVMKKGNNEYSDIEWEIHFPKAERYLEMRMSHPQIRCYIFLLTIYKTFIEKTTSFHGLLIEHLRTHMFWECEADAKNWPEHKMGAKLLQVIEDLNSGLSVSKIPHYFIKGKNIFENIPSKYLHFAQKIFHEILQFPVMHFIEAIKKLKYVQKDYYPKPDLDQLQRILTKTELKIPLRNKQKKRISKVVARPSVRPLGMTEETKQKIKDQKWKIKNEMNNRQKHLAKQRQKEEEAAKNEKPKEENKLQMTITNLNTITQISVLQFFMHHFIEIAKTSRRIGPKSQTLFYLKQAEYNMSVLEDIGGVCSDTEKAAEIITKERQLLERESSYSNQDIAPPTPARNPDQNSFNFLPNNPKTALRFKSSFKNDSETPRQKRVLFRTKSVGFNDQVDISPN